MEEKRKSSNIQKFEYDAESKTLEVTFVSGKTYTYNDVPSEIFKGFGKAESHGSYFHRSVRSKFEGKPKPVKDKDQK